MGTYRPTTILGGDSPLDLERRVTVSLDFLRFRNEEFDELILNHNKK